MDDKIIATFCLCDDLLKAMHHQENRQCQMNDAEIMTTALLASFFFRNRSGITGYAATGRSSSASV